LWVFHFKFLLLDCIAAPAGIDKNKAKAL
jgi:hypothetical protein